MRLSIGDKLYLKPDISKSMFHFGLDSELGANQKYEELSNKPFIIVQVRNTKLLSINDDDVCIIWIDGSNWWWDQIGGKQPWTNLFISEKEFNRNKKLIELGIED